MFDEGTLYIAKLISFSHYSIATCTDNSSVECFTMNKWICMFWSMKHCWSYIKTLVPVRHGFWGEVSKRPKVHANIEPNYNDLSLYYAVNRLDASATESTLLRNSWSLYRNFALHARFAVQLLGYLKSCRYLCLCI